MLVNTPAELTWNPITLTGGPTPDHLRIFLREHGGVQRKRFASVGPWYARFSGQQNGRSATALSRST